MNIERDETIEEENEEAAAAIEEMSKGQIDELVSSFDVDIKQDQQPVAPIANEAAILSEAQLRLRKAKYYEALLDQDLFSGAEDDICAQEVQQELRNLVVERLQVLLGMAQTVSAGPAIDENLLEDMVRDAVDEAFFRILGSQGIAFLRSQSPAKLAALDSISSKISNSNKTYKPTAPAAVRNAVASTEPTVNAAFVDAVPKVNTAKAPIKKTRSVPKKKALPQKQNPVKKIPKGKARVGQVRPPAGGPKPLPMPNPQQAAAKTVSEIVTTPKGNVGPLELAIAKAIDDRK